MGKCRDKVGKKIQGKDSRQDKTIERQERARLKKERQRNGYYCSDADDKEFEAQVGQIGCRIQFMEGDGNCLFRSLADQLEGRPQDHAVIRAQIMLHLERNREVFEPYMEDDESFDDYLDRMRGDAEWGGNQELVAASQLFKVNVVVHQFKAPRLFIPFEKARRSVHLSYHGDYHYNSVRVAGDDGTGPAMPISLQAPGSGSQARDAAKSTGAKSPWPMEEEAVSRSCPWADSSSIVDALKATGGRSDEAIEVLIAARNEAALMENNGVDGQNVRRNRRQRGSTSMEGSETRTSGAIDPGPTRWKKGSTAGALRGLLTETASGSSTGTSSSPSGGNIKAKKIARGADCPCGSGQKYKKCCRKKDTAIAQGRLPAAVDRNAGVADSSLADDLGALVI